MIMHILKINFLCMGKAQGRIFFIIMKIWVIESGGDESPIKSGVDELSMYSSGNELLIDSGDDELLMDSNVDELIPLFNTN